MNKKGFTLIELLAVILILAIIAAIISPIVGKIIENAREQSARRSAERYAGAAQEYYVESQMDFSKADNLGTNIIDKLELQNEDGTGYITAYPDGTTEMAIVISNICFTKTTTQDPKDIEASKDISNCKVNSSNARVSSIDSKDTSIDINIDNSNDTSVSITSCKFGTSRNDMSTDGTISGNTCTLTPTVSGKRYYYEIIFSDGSKRNGTVQGGTGTSTFNQGGSGYTGGGDHGGGAGGSGSGGSGTGVAAPVQEEANGRTVYTGRMVSPVKIVYFNVTTGTKCDIVDFTGNGGNTTNGKSSGCLRFYAYMEDNLSYTMILDRNLDNGAYVWYGTSDNGSGPVTAYGKLKEFTADWQGTVTPKNYINVYVVNGTESAYRIAYDTDGAHARFITTDEIARITGNTNFSSVTTGEGGWFFLDGGTSASTGATWQTQIATASEPSAYSWLFSYLDRCGGYGCSAGGHTYGYWTSDAMAGTTQSAWIVGYDGWLRNDVGYYDYGRRVNSGMIGIRPVITVLKSTLN